MKREDLKEIIPNITEEQIAAMRNIRSNNIRCRNSEIEVLK